MKRVGLVLVALLMLGTASNASNTWVGGASGDWSNPANWSTATQPSSSETAVINNAVVTADVPAAFGQLILSNVANSNATLLVNNPSVTLVIAKSSTEDVSGAYADPAIGTLDLRAGSVRVYNTSGTNGEYRLSHSYTATCQGTIKLSGVGILDLDVLSKGDKAAVNSTFVGTGGTLIIRNQINKFGLVSGGYSGFHLGSSLLAPGGIGTVGAQIGVGLSQNTDFFADTGTLEFDIASATSYDQIKGRGTCDLTDGAALSVQFLAGYTPAAQASWDLWVPYDANSSGAGIPTLRVPTGYNAGDFSLAWLDMVSDPNGWADTLRLTYVPEPAALVMLVGGLGWLLIRRKAA
ncbi:MAG: PEP-CTERM sorting domain-containing protein [Phycisphaerae bacterium]|jgi:hypothetical protein